MRSVAEDLGALVFQDEPDSVVRASKACCPLILSKLLKENQESSPRKGAKPKLKLYQSGEVQA